MKEIPLTKGKVALVDDEDWQAVSEFPWYAHGDDTGYYAVHNERIPGTRRQRKTFMHHFILGVTCEVDHRDRNGLNNQRANLRFATHGQNCHNVLKQNKTGYRGVSKMGVGWHARIGVDMKRKYLGYYTTAEAAARAYDAAAREIYGEFAVVNFGSESGDFI